MPKTITDELKNYFEPLARGINEVQYVKTSGSDQLDKLLTDSRSTDVYPGVFLLRPRYKIEDNGASNFMAWYDLVFYVFCSHRPDDDDAQDAAAAQAEGIATDIYKQLIFDDNRECMVDRTAYYMEPVNGMTIDSTAGYEVRARIGLGINHVLYATT